jgi:ATP phosphoribosyltransferase
MNLSSNTNLKIAIQKSGRLNEDTVKLLNSAGLQFDNYKQKLLNTCQNLPIDIIFLRDDDIPIFVNSGVVDLGIVGKDVLSESNVQIDKLFDLGFGRCSLWLAVPQESNIQTVNDFRNLKIATSFPFSTKKFFEEKKIPVEIIKINGSVEISPAIGISDAIADIVSTGNSLIANDLRKVEKIYDTEAVLIANKFLNIYPFKKKLVNNLLLKIKSQYEPQ